MSTAHVNTERVLDISVISIIDGEVRKFYVDFIYISDRHTLLLIGDTGESSKEKKSGSFFVPANR